MNAAILQKKTERQQFFVRNTFRSFFVPALISSVWLAVAGVADSVFIGNAIGAPGLAAISLGQPVYLFYNILSYGFSIGGSIHYAAALAQGHEEEGNRIFLSVVALLLIVYVVTASLGLLFLPQLMRLLGADPADGIVRTYIHTQLIFVPIMFCQGPFYYFVNADNGPKLAAAAMTLSGMLDALFSYVFVIHMKLGVAGSVYSTVVGAVVMLALTGWHIARRRGALRFGLMKIDWHTVALALAPSAPPPRPSATQNTPRATATSTLSWLSARTRPVSLTNTASGSLAGVLSTLPNPNMRPLS